MSGETTRDQLRRALALLQQGQLANAQTICRQVLTAQPEEFHALHLLGTIALLGKDFIDADRWFRAAIAANPNQPAAHSNLAAAQLGLQCPLEALVHAERALRLEIGLAEAWMNRANALGELQRLDESLESYDRAISLAPSLRDAHFGRGNVLSKMRRFRESAESYDRALQIDPNQPEALNNRGTALLNLDLPEEALEMFEQALRQRPNFADALNNQGSALRRLRRPMEAIASYELALRLTPESSQIWSNLANVMLALGKLDEALRYSDQALTLDPEFTEALNIRATALRDLGRQDEAAGSYARLVQVAPNFDYAIGNCLFARANLCDWSDRDGQIFTILGAVREGRRASLPFSFLSISDSAAAQLQCASTFIGDRCPTRVAHWQKRAYRHDRIRVGYVSGDFREHAVSYLLAGVLECHDKDRFETFGFSLRAEQQSAFGQRIKRAFSHFIDISSRSDRAVAELLASLEIDIAVDLTGYTAGMRPEIFARRAAPIQVNYLGFPGTMGREFLDYIIADEFVVPPRLRNCYGERVVYLPDCFQSYDDRRAFPTPLSTRAAAGLPEDKFVFCSFNNSYKINPTMFDVWMRLLQRVPESVLWLLGDRESVRNNLEREAMGRGVDPGRLCFAGRCSYEKHLGRLPLADLFLDSLPFNAGTTASDALSAGLPVLTAPGEAFASRMAGSLLSALAMPELIADGLGEYETRALRLAQQPDELRLLRARLAAGRLKAPLFNSDRFRRHLESAYDRMWQRWQDGEAPADFTVQPCDS